MIRDWIDTYADLFGTLEYEGKQVRSYRVYNPPETPISLDTDMFPCAMHFVAGINPNYTAGISTQLVYGTSEFHLTPVNAPDLRAKFHDYYPLIAAKYAGNLTLGGLVDSLKLAAGVVGEGSLAVRFVELQYTDEPAHLGIVTSWVVKETISDEITVAGG